jgi:hypothetical protein
MTRTYGRSERGARLVARVPYGRWETTTFLGAMRSTAFVAPLCVEGAIHGGVVRAWVEQHLVKSLREGDIVVMDDLSSQKPAGVVTAIEAASARVRYLPPYSRRRGADHRKTLDALRPRPRLVHRTRVPKLPPPLWPLQLKEGGARTRH